MREDRASERDSPDEGRLTFLLQRSGATLEIAELRDLLGGVAAAPAGFDPDAWMQLVADQPTPELRAALSALLAAERRRMNEPVADTHADRLARLRAEMRRRNLAGFLVPRSDEHQGEYVAAQAERLAWLTGFTGSAGTAAVLRDRAALFVDGRYTTQATAEVDRSLFTIRHVTEEPLADWLSGELTPKARLGYDAWLHTPSQVAALERSCKKAGARAVLVDNLIDHIWADRPPPPIAPIVPHGDQFVGRTSQLKREDIAQTLREEKQDAVILTQPESITWLLNIRGGDVPFSPLPLTFGIMHADCHFDLFVDPRKLTGAARAHLGPMVTIAPTATLADALDRLGREQRKVQIDPDKVPDWVARRLRVAGSILAEATDPCLMPKAIKTSRELVGMRAAHERDGAALTRFLAWLAATAGNGGLTESAAAKRLADFRAQNEHYRGPSFPTISAAGANAAIVHYRVSPASDRPLAPGTLYLVDSGAQYLDGTTDVTRTVAIGEPTAEMRQRFTLVLKGHIAIATALFPHRTTGSQLDALARQSMWRAGLDYDHGTGHGVGYYLSVHEGPQRISKLPSSIPLQPGMIVSNEPGYYKPGAYGIRIENLVAVRQAEMPVGADQELFGFETLTLAPIDRVLIDRALLDPPELAWVNEYHARVNAILSPLIDEATRQWLSAATRPL